MMISLKNIPEFPPHTATVDVTFGQGNYLPNYEELPEEYQGRRALGCQIASTIFYAGWEEVTTKYAKELGPEIDLKGPPSDHEFEEDELRDPIERFQRCISAHLKSFEPKHEHKIAGVGYLIDLWIGHINPKPQGDD